MPTGYTEKIYRGEDQTFEEFVLDCARNFGALITLRDSPEADIPDQFEPPSYYRDKLVEAEDDLRRWTEMSNKEAAADLRRTQRETAAKRQEVIEKARDLRVRYQQMLEQVSAWNPPTEDHVNLKEFMIQQIVDSERSDCSTTYLPEPPDVDVATWRQDRIDKARKDIAYYAKQYAEDCERAAERTAWVRALRESLDTEVKV